MALVSASPFGGALTHRPARMPLGAGVDAVPRGKMGHFIPARFMFFIPAILLGTPGSDHSLDSTGVSPFPFTARAVSVVRLPRSVSTYVTEPDLLEQKETLGHDFEPNRLPATPASVTRRSSESGTGTTSSGSLGDTCHAVTAEDIMHIDEPVEMERPELPLCTPPQSSTGGSSCDHSHHMECRICLNTQQDYLSSRRERDAEFALAPFDQAKRLMFNVARKRIPYAARASEAGSSTSVGGAAAADATASTGAAGVGGTRVLAATTSSGSDASLVSSDADYRAPEVVQEQQQQQQRREFRLLNSNYPIMSTVHDREELARRKEFAEDRRDDAFHATPPRYMQTACSSWCPNTHACTKCVYKLVQRSVGEDDLGGPRHWMFPDGTREPESDSPGSDDSIPRSASDLQRAVEASAEEEEALRTDPNWVGEQPLRWARPYEELHKTTDFVVLPSSGGNGANKGKIPSPASEQNPAASKTRSTPATARSWPYLLPVQCKTCRGVYSAEAMRDVLRRGIRTDRKEGGIQGHLATTGYLVGEYVALRRPGNEVSPTASAAVVYNRFCDDPVGKILWHMHEIVAESVGKARRKLEERGAAYFPEVDALLEGLRRLGLEGWRRMGGSPSPRSRAGLRERTTRDPSGRQVAGTTSPRITSKQKQNQGQPPHRVQQAHTKFPPLVFVHEVAEKLAEAIAGTSNGKTLLMEALEDLDVKYRLYTADASVKSAAALSKTVKDVGEGWTAVELPDECCRGSAIRVQRLDHLTSRVGQSGCGSGFDAFGTGSGSAADVEECSHVLPRPPILYDRTQTERKLRSLWHATVLFGGREPNKEGSDESTAVAAAAKLGFYAAHLYDAVDFFARDEGANFDAVYLQEGGDGRDSPASDSPRSISVGGSGEIAAEADASTFVKDNAPPNYHVAYLEGSKDAIAARERPARVEPTFRDYVELLPRLPASDPMKVALTQNYLLGRKNPSDGWTIFHYAVFYETTFGYRMLHRSWLSLAWLRRGVQAAFASWEAYVEGLLDVPGKVLVHDFDAARYEEARRQIRAKKTARCLRTPLGGQTPENKCSSGIQTKKQGDEEQQLSVWLLAVARADGCQNAALTGEILPELVVPGIREVFNLPDFHARLLLDKTSPSRLSAFHLAPSAKTQRFLLRFYSDFMDKAGNREALYWKLVGKGRAGRQENEHVQRLRIGMKRNFLLGKWAFVFGGEERNAPDLPTWLSRPLGGETETYQENKLLSEYEETLVARYDVDYLHFLFMASLGDANGDTLLHRAAKGRDLEMIAKLLRFRQSGPPEMPYYVPLPKKMQFAWIQRTQINSTTEDAESSAGSSSAEESSSEESVDPFGVVGWHLLLNDVALPPGHAGWADSVDAAADADSGVEVLAPAPPPEATLGVLITRPKKHSSGSRRNMWGSWWLGSTSTSVVGEEETGMIRYDITPWAEVARQIFVSMRNEEGQTAYEIWNELGNAAALSRDEQFWHHDHLKVKADERLQQLLNAFKPPEGRFGKARL